jgi:hypothetical protein
MKTYTTLKQKASQTCDNNSNIFITTHKVVYKNGKKSSVELAESFISRDALDKVFVYTTPKMQRVKTNDTAIKCFIYIHTKLKNSKRPNLRFSYFELLDSLKRKSSTIENILKYLENDLRVINHSSSRHL